MPATAEEAQTIVAVCRKYLSAPCLISMSVELDELVGSRTDNDSLKTTLKMLRTASEAACLCADSTDGQEQWRADSPQPQPGPHLWQPAAGAGMLPRSLRRAALWLSLFVLVASHFALLSFMLLAALLLPFQAAWYMALPSIVYIVNLVFTRDPCPLTLLENALRGGLGIPLLSGGFIGHYLIKPARAWAARVLPEHV